MTHSVLVTLPFRQEAQAMLQAVSRPPSGFYSLWMTVGVVSKSLFQVPGKGRDRRFFEIWPTFDSTPLKQLRILAKIQSAPEPTPVCPRVVFRLLGWHPSNWGHAGTAPGHCLATAEVT